MVSVAPRGLSQIPFRRDVKLFLGALVGFLIVLLLILLLLLQSFALKADALVRSDWDSLADAAVYAISGAGSIAPAESFLSVVRERYGIQAIEIHNADGSVVRSGQRPTEESSQRLQKLSGSQRILLWFDASELRSMKRTFDLTALIALASSILATILLILYLPRIVRPVEEMLAHARELGQERSGMEESRYLIETFKRSIDTMKAQEEELRRLHDAQKMRADELQRISATLTRSLTSGFVALDAFGRIVDMNAAGREMAGIAQERDCSGERPEDLLPEGEFRDVLHGAIDERQSLSRLEVRMDPARDLVAGLTTVPLLGESGQFLGMLALFTDLTPIRHLEDRIREMQTLADLGEISAGIAHEFRNSLSTVLGYLKLARRSPLGEEALDRIRKAEEEATLLSAAVQRLLAFARPMEIERQTVDLLVLAREVAAMLTESSPASTAIDVFGSPVLVEGDRALLARLLENLMRNAAESVQQKGSGDRVEVEVSGHPQPRIEVRDRGVGFNPDKAARLFLPFQSEKPNGFGLGLALAKKITFLHGGTIRLDGEEGVGATATIELPPAATRTESA
jgi:signal transduction histidine kinase